jgi:hypothetical protein
VLEDFVDDQEFLAALGAYMVFDNKVIVLKKNIPRTRAKAI